MAVLNSSKFDFREAVNKELMYFNKDVAEIVYDVIPEVAQEAVEKLRATSPKRGGKGGGKYAKSWTWMRDQGRLNVVATVYSRKPNYRLTHLLEKGHDVSLPKGYVRRDGKRTFVEARPHIAAVEEWAINEAIDRIAKRLG